MRWPFDNQAARQPRKRITVPGWAPPPLARSIEALEQRLAATALRVSQKSLVNTPGAIKGERLFIPDTTQVRTVNATSVNDIVKTGATYGVEIPYNAPGVFVARSMTVSIQYRLWVANSGAPYVMWPSIQTGAAGGGWAYTTNVSLYTTGTDGAPPATYMWNLEDPRSGKRLSDDFMSCMALLPAYSASTIVTPGGLMRFDTPWMLERDSQLQFQYRPLTDIVQSAAGGSENSTRNQTVRVRVELHGTRYFTDQDAMRKGAIVP